jgi:hypothetical protein
MPAERLRVYEELTKGVRHLYSKGKFQQDVFDHYVNLLYPLAEEDPLFLAKLTAYILQNSDSKDLKVICLYINSLSSADGNPFFPGSTLNKPNLRIVSALLLQKVDPVLAARIATIAAECKWSYKNTLRFARHYSNTLRTGLKKYIAYREARPDMVKGIVRAGLKNRFQDIYRYSRTAPTAEVAQLLRWKQKDGKVVITQADTFEGLTDLQIANKIVEEKISVPVALSKLPRAVTPVIAVALLQIATPNQLVILRSLFDDAGISKDPMLLKVFGEKASKATAVDRIERINTQISASMHTVLAEAKSVSQKATVGKFGIGKVFLHLDCSVSMNKAIEFAKEAGATIAELVPNPETNFAWGRFGTEPRKLPNPPQFTKDHFHQVLYGHRATDPGTNVFGCYQMAREFGADVDVYVTDQLHTMGSANILLDGLARQYGKPKSVLVVYFPPERPQTPLFSVQRAFEALEVPVATISPEDVKSPAGVAQAIATAMKGNLAIVDAIMNTPLPEVPNWYSAVEV